VSSGTKDLTPIEDDQRGDATALRGCLYYLLAGILAAVAYFLIPSTDAKNVLYALVGLSAPAAIAVGIRVRSPSFPLPWYLLASGLLLFVVGDAIWNLQQSVLGEEPPFPSIADTFYLTGYPVLAAGLALMIRTHAPGREWPSLIDALIIATVVGMLSWTFLMAPYVKDPTLSLAERLVSIAYPLADVLLAAILVRLLFVPGKRLAAYDFLSVGVAFLMIADTVYAAMALTGGYETGNPADLGWMLSYVFFGAAALHPSMTSPVDSHLSSETRLTWWRLALLTGTMLLAPGVLAVQAALGERADVSVVVVGSVVLFLLVSARMAGIVRERERAEEKLGEAEERHRTLVEQVPALVYIEDIETRATLYDSPRIETMLGYPANTYQKDPSYWEKILHPEDRERVMAAEAESLEDGQFSLEYRVMTRDGRVVWVHDEAKIVHDEEGRPRFWQGVVFDITQRKRAEVEIQKAREAAEAASGAKSQFLANMSHEIRTPMNGVIGMTGLLLDTELTPEQREYAETVRTSGENLLTIINDILDFSKIEAGRMELETIDFDLGTVVEEALGLFAESAHAKGLELASLVEREVPTALRGDPGRLTQVLTNLLGNAIKFTEAGEVVLHVRRPGHQATDGSATTTMIRFEVKDTGIGMTEEQQSKLFRSFTQADASTTRRYGGTGLGLAISKQLVELMGGEIGLQSELGVGSTFFFEVPLTEQQQQREGSSLSAPAARRADLRELRVLVVDDNATNRKIVHHQVISWGMNNGMAEDGPSALSKLRSAKETGEPYDLAIIDMQMPMMDGMQLAREIKADPAIAPTRLIMLTSLSWRADTKEARQAGISAYLTKPVRQSKLFDAIATVMGTPEEVAPHEEARRLEVEQREEEEEEEKAVSGSRILVAEDNQVNQKVAVRMLERMGYRADVAADGLEAIEALSRVPYAAVLMDVQMPEMDGYAATAELRRREQEEGGQGRRTPIIAMTANAMEGDRERAIEAGMDDYLTKPVKREELAAVLERWVLEEGGVLPDHEEAKVGKTTTAAAAQTEEAPLDRAVVENLREFGGQEMLSELSQMFLDDASSALRDLKEAIESEDPPLVERTAHTLKGSSSNMGAKTMAALCAGLQDAGTSGDLSRAPELLGRLEAEFERVRLELEAEVTRG
jgi:two-component system sensor histidine kinase/response regulator